ncbi:class II aldolase/adducin family protein [Kaistia nematophila]|uniref:Class II aldolase/adducin family protein n=1 Tax=Kaistia nematophila TaxID=2994654 RepID=A0A9X3INR9_9HYPH|nr:class II aldolase/adducin family protein [Kaistia nematophila]MCX5571866.1 class II aldolase/adducin family protein [Kaistia nematophila]
MPTGAGPLTTLQDDPEFASLRRFSARLGKDPLRTQAAGGNTSLKRDGVLWVKASGTWLAEAEERDIFLPVSLPPLLDAIHANDERAAKATDFVVADANPLGLRPSVETSVHAVLPQDAVLHIHCVETVARVARADARDQIAARLDGLEGIIWSYVPYVKPGLPLAREIDAVSPPGTNVVLLGNHGLIVAADTVEAAVRLIERVGEALAEPARPAPAGDLGALEALAEGSPYRLPDDPAAHATATDPARLAIAARGTLYPDHVVFLGSGTAVLAEGDTPAAVAKRAALPPMLLAVPGKGVLIHRDVLRGGDALARALAEVTGRIAADAPLRFLTIDEEQELVTWDAEIYRRSLAGASKR